MATLAGVVHRHLQTAYTGLQKPPQQEWAFVQRVTPGIGMEFKEAEDAMQDTFLLSLFQGSTSQISGREITGLIFK